MEKIIQKSIEGGYNGTAFGHQWAGIRTFEHPPKTIDDQARFCAVLLDPLFWQALGKACGWEDECDMLIEFDYTRSLIPEYQFNALVFHEINLTQGMDKAVEYLEALMK